MRIKQLLVFSTIILAVFVFSKCSETAKEKDMTQKSDFCGFESQIKWGEHLVIVGGCGDCHTPKKMTPQGPVEDKSLLLSGRPAQMPSLDVDRKEIESKGLVITQDLTEWVGPWGVSYAANLTPDETGIGNWQESNFITALKEGKFKGIKSARNLLPPMPVEATKNYTDDEAKAMFAYLKSIKPIKNLVPNPLPPVSTNQPPAETDSK